MDRRPQARDLGLLPQTVGVEGPSPEFEKAFGLMDDGQAEALIVLEAPINQPHRRKIADLAAARRWPTVFPMSMVDAGGLFTYGTSLREAAGHMAGYVDKVLKGARPGDLPIVAALSHELVVNLQTARTLGVTVPPELLKRADQVIQ
jgi:putative ABC transport system substrate-binding protein